MRNLLWILTFIFFLLSWWWYVCPHKQVCPWGQYAQNRSLSAQGPSPHESQENELALSKMDSLDIHAYESGQVFFNWSDDKPHSGKGFIRVRDSILATLESSDILRITGLYYPTEENNTAFSDLGYARANKAKLLFRSLGSDRFKLESDKIRRLTKENMDVPVAAVTFKRMVQNASIRDIGGKVIINFPHASDEMLENPEVDAYLTDLVLQLQSSQEYAYIVGHTDNTASTRRNISLGWKRANAIRSLLLRKGLPANRIITESAGEAYPIASNDTEDGRRENRRVEVTILNDLN